MCRHLRSNFPLGTKSCCQLCHGNRLISEQENFATETFGLKSEQTNRQHGAAPVRLAEYSHLRIGLNQTGWLRVGKRQKEELLSSCTGKRARYHRAFVRAGYRLEPIRNRARARAICWRDIPDAHGFTGSGIRCAGTRI